MKSTTEDNNRQPIKSPLGDLGVFGLIGFPLKHSFSSKFFAEKFAREGINAEYFNFETEDIEQINQIILHNRNLRGFNVTIPYKEQIIQFLHQISPEAENIGAVNVVKIVREAAHAGVYRLLGFNTDYIGFRQSIEPIIRPEIHKKALILGTGGASKAVAQAFADLNIDWKYVSRTSKENRFTYADLNEEIIREYKIIVNASPVGTFPNSDVCPDIPYGFLTSEHLLYDLVYNPTETLFLKNGKAHGAAVKNGEEMLHLQAEAAWQIWSEQ